MRVIAALILVLSITACSAGGQQNLVRLFEPDKPAPQPYVYQPPD